MNQNITKGNKQKTLPFNVNQLSKMINSEFYLMVMGHEKRKQMTRELQKRKVSKKAKNTLNEIDGLLGEVINRKPSYCEFYHLSELSGVVLDDGTLLGKKIKDVFGMYIFKMETVQINDNSPPILTGSVQPYDLHNNYVGAPLDQKVTLHMTQIPTHKVKNDLACL